MKTDLVNQAQPFGRVMESREHPNNMPNAKGIGSKSLGGDRMVHNNGATTQVSNADKNPGAFDYASRNGDNPFAFVGGMPKKGR